MPEPTEAAINRAQLKDRCKKLILPMVAVLYCWGFALYQQELVYEYDLLNCSKDIFNTPIFCSAPRQVPTKYQIRATVWPLWVVIDPPPMDRPHYNPDRA